MTNVLTSLTALMERVKTVITDPTGCWDVVASDSRDARTLFKVYAVPMAVLGALAGTVGTFLMGLASLIGVGGLAVQFVTAFISTCAAGFIAAFIATKIASFVGEALPLIGPTVGFCTPPWWVSWAVSPSSFRLSVCSLHSWPASRPSIGVGRGSAR